MFLVVKQPYLGHHQEQLNFYFTHTYRTVHGARADWRSEPATLARAISLPKAGDLGSPCRAAGPGPFPFPLPGPCPCRGRCWPLAARTRHCGSASPARGEGGRAQELLVQSRGVCQGQQSRGLLCTTPFLNKTGTLSSQLMLLFQKLFSVSSFQYGYFLYVDVDACDPYVPVFMVVVDIIYIQVYSGK